MPDITDDIVEPMPATRTKPPWDRRSWVVGGVGGVMATLFFVVGIKYSPGSKDEDLYMLIGVAAMLAIFIFLPMTLAIIARRRWLLWPYLPTAILFVVFIFGSAFMPTFFDGSSGGQVGSDTSSRAGPTASEYRGLVVALSLPFFTSLPIILLRYFKARKKRLREAELALEVIAAPTEGVWPPRPTDYH